MVINDANHMLGMSSAMRREDYVPGAVAAGGDMLLLFSHMEEDFTFMFNGVKKGVITQKRLNDAVRRSRPKGGIEPAKSRKIPLCVLA